MANAKILIVEDQYATAKKIEKGLLKMGYEVTSIVRFGEEVVESIENNMPDLVLMDIVLEGKMDGIDASEQVHERFDIPVVFLTAFADNIKLERAKITQPFGYLIKPFAFTELRVTIESAIYKHEAEKKLKTYQNDLETMVKVRTHELEESNTKLTNEIVEREQLEGRLRKLNLAVVQSPAMVMITDTKGNIEYVNPKFTKVTGYEATEVMGQKPSILKSGHHSTDEYRRVWDRLLSGEEWHGEFYNKSKDCEYYWESASISPLRDEEGLITNFVKVAEDITYHKNAEKELIKSQCELENRVAERTEDLSNVNKELLKSLKEKDVLLREIHHRVKNNMQLITSLISLRTKSLKDKECISIFEDCVNKIKSMALLHEHLYNSNDFGKIDLGGYLKTIINELSMSFGVNRKKIKEKIKNENVSLGIDDAIPFGLIINELVSNILKHAFPDGKIGEVNIEIRLTNKNELELIVRDNGIGLPRDIDLENLESLGLRLVNGLVTKQLRGKLEINSENGTEIYIRFKKREVVNV